MTPHEQELRQRIDTAMVQTMTDHRQNMEVAYARGSVTRPRCDCEVCSIHDGNATAALVKSMFKKIGWIK